jgi:hypothetical protein
VADCVAAGRDLNLDGNCSYLVRRCTLGNDPNQVVAGRGNVIDPNALENPVEVQQGDSDVAPACVLPGDPSLPLGPCPCAPPELCSDSLLPPRLFTLLSADSDGDGVLDATETCDATPIPIPSMRRRRRTPATVSSAATAGARRGVIRPGPGLPGRGDGERVLYGGPPAEGAGRRTESAVNPGKRGKVPSRSWRRRS